MPGRPRFGTPENLARASYEQLIRANVPAAESHEILISVAMDPRRVTRQIRDSGGGDRGTATVVVKHLEQLAYKLASVDLLVDGMLTPRQVGQVLREQVDPSSGCSSRRPSPPATSTWPASTPPRRGRSPPTRA